MSEILRRNSGSDGARCLLLARHRAEKSTLITGVVVIECDAGFVPIAERLTVAESVFDGTLLGWQADDAGGVDGGAAVFYAASRVVRVASCA